MYENFEVSFIERRVGIAEIVYFWGYNFWSFYFLLRFHELCEYDHALESRTDGPAGHEGELFLRMVSCFESLHVSGFYGCLLYDFVCVFLLEIVDRDLVTILESIQKCKYVVVLALDPWIVRRVSKDEYIPRIPWFCSSWVAYDSLLQLFHKCLMHRLEGRSRSNADIDERDIFPDTRDDDTVLIGSQGKCRTEVSVSELRDESLRIIASRVDDGWIRGEDLLFHRSEIFLIFECYSVRSVHLYTRGRYDMSDFITCRHEGLWTDIVHDTRRVGTVVESCEQYHEDTTRQSEIDSEKS